MGSLYLFITISWVLFLPTTHQLQTSQTQVLLQMRKYLEYPSSMEVLANYNGDICSISATPHMTISCQENSIIELRVMGDKPAKVSDFHGFPIPNSTLSESFSIDSFVTTLSRLANLRVLSLVSLGIWGQIPDKIHRLSSIELLDLSSNFFFGQIPQKMSTMVKINTLILDDNFFNHTIPDWLDSFSNLSILSLRSNRLKGQFPFLVCKVRTLVNLALYHNELSGKLPDLSALTSLHVLDLRENRLDSELPTLPETLITALLSRNRFSGKIPSHFGNTGHLQHLDLSFNSLTGPPPPVLFSLPNITYLNLASNLLSGSLPSHLNCGGKLGFIDISSNKLIGDLPSCLDNSSDKRMINFGGNCLSIESQHQHQASFCKESKTRRDKSRVRETAVFAAIISGAILVVMLLALGVLFLYQRRHRTRRALEQNVLPKALQDNPPASVSSELLANARLISQAVKMGTQAAPVSRTFSLEELKEITNSFHHSMFLGEGSIGKLYRGKLENGSCVAVRCLSLSKKYSVLNLTVRLDLLSRLHHPHLVGLLGHCIHIGGQDDSTGANKVFLVYEYVSNGNYRTCLSEESSEKALKWSDRLAVLIGIAKAVYFLHSGAIHGPFNHLLKTNSILLDENGIAKLSDYGMSIINEETKKFEARGEGLKTSSRKSMENDVYNFGYILLESLVGPIVTRKGEALLLNDMASFGSLDGRRRIVDPIVLMTCSQESLSRVISITKKCIASEKSSRPSFEDVLWNLQYAAQVQATADADQKLDSIS